MTWTIEYTRSARRRMRKLPRTASRRIENYMNERVAPLDNPRRLGRLVISGMWEGFWRYRVGDYRAICDIQYATRRIIVVTAAPRADLY